MTILIIGLEEDMPSRRIHDVARARGIKTAYFDTIQYPRKMRLTYSTHGELEGFYQEDPRAERIPLSEIVGVYRRWSKGIWSPSEPDPVLNEIVYWNNESGVGTFFRCLTGANWVNPAGVTDDHRYKGYQLQLIAEQGVRVPHTLITNDPETVREYHERWGGKCIYKPVRGWAHTTPLTPEALSDENLDKLALSPISLQEMIEGIDIRIYVTGEKIYAMEIHADTMDFREQENAPRVAIKLPPEVKKTCLLINKTLGYVYSGIDCRRTPEGEYVFFEANPSPVFLLDEQVTGYPIGDSIVDLLLGQ